MTRKRALAHREHQQQVRRVTKFGRSALLLLATLLSFGTLGLLAADQLYRPDFFVIDQLKIKGKLQHLDPARVKQTVERLQLGNFFSIDLRKVKNAVEQMQWVQNADVRREWPNSLMIRINEHRPVMRWGREQWVNSLGQVINLPENPALRSPTTLYGNENDSQLMLARTLRWKQELAPTGLQLSEVSLSGSHAWTLLLHDPRSQHSFELLLGRDDVEQRLVRFRFLYASQLQRNDLRLDRVDARYPDGLAVSSTRLASESQLAVQESNDTLTGIRR
ncbi:MAG: FtsQ-type POTRA domain-containing protein [Arenicella sp.]|nr:FtsQ-type POTRA domain-containing protein [Arenicella sp.]